MPNRGTTPARHLSRKDLADTLDVIDAARRAESVDQLAPLLQRTLRLIPITGLDVYVAERDADGGIIRNQHQAGIRHPSAWTDAYRAEGLARIDPVPRHLHESAEPLVWSRIRKRFRGAAQQRFYAAAEAFGLRDGFAYGVPFAQSTKASFFSGYGEDLASHRRHLAVLHYVLPHLHGAVERSQRSALSSRRPELTAREREMLSWAQHGKTNQGIALALGLSERTVKFHIENAMHKLGAANRTQAIAIALASRLISP